MENELEKETVDFYTLIKDKSSIESIAKKFEKAIDDIQALESFSEALVVTESHLGFKFPPYPIR
ncbi:hypothetical protein HDU96_003362, partial [Phlyctochytrium bullatum]